MLTAELKLDRNRARLSIRSEFDPLPVVGFWSAAATAIFIAAFDLTFSFSLAGIDATVAAVVASLAIAPCFVAAMVTLHRRAAEPQRIWTGISVAFAGIYATLIILNYMLQITVVRQNPQAYPWLTMAFNRDSAFWAFEVFGYLFMSLAAVFALPAMRGRLNQALPWLFATNLATAAGGTVVYIVTGDPVHPVVLAGLGVWSILFLAGIMIVALQFRDDKSRGLRGAP